MKTASRLNFSSPRSNASTGQLVKSLATFLPAALLALTATAQITTGTTGTTGIDATGNTASEIAACNDGSSQQTRDTCLLEARNAAAAKRANQLNTNPGAVDANAAQRCDALQGDDKLACQARMTGAGTTQGSVSGGGVIRELEVIVPATPASGTRQ